MSFAAMPVQAQTTTSTSAQIQAQIQALLAQIAALQAQLGTSGGTTVSTTYTRDLTIGSRGTDVIALQTFLISKGFSIPAGPTGYFGIQTRAALAAFQAANGISPAAGYFGPITRARIIAIIGGGVTPPPSPGGGLQGGAGRLVDVDELGDVESDLDEGDEDVKVVGVEMEAQDSDAEIQRLDVEFDLSAATTESTRLDRYVDRVSIWLDGKELASMDASDGDRDSDVTTFRFANLRGVIREGDTGKLYVVVDTVTTVDSDDAGLDIDATIPQDGLRAIDAQGVSETYVDSDISNTFTVNEASAGDLILTESADNPDDTVVEADEDATTDDVTLVSFRLRANHQDVTINDLPVNLGVTGTTNVSDVVQTVRLMRGNTTVDTATVSGSGTNVRVVFSDLDETIADDDTETYDVVADIRRIETTGGGSAFTAGDTLVASTSNNSSWDVEDEDGDQIDPTGSVTGGTVTFETTGITVTKVDATATKSTGTTVGSADYTQYTISFRVTAAEDDLYIDRSVQNTSSPSAAGGGASWATTTSSTAGVTTGSVTSLAASDTNNGDTSTSYKVPAGTSRVFSLNVTLTATATGFTGVQLTGINYDTDSNTNDSTTYFTAGLDTFKTQDITMTTH